MMTTDKRTDLHRAKVGVSILATCIVQTMNESDPTFTDRFLQRLSAAYSDLKDNTDGDVMEQLELLSWTRSLLTGFDHIHGQGKPFLAD
ncbi:hypothetical protein CO674_33190 [Rhizobium hidalgonense]|uniref:Uncharacterized protein n=2 Tax=Rhizobium hidalgonense TaxID=1538159 RepID=A0ABX4JH67_9HYPH|nr:hypothetical protein CO674_33190 [Rhizobium hidalgonense]